MNLKIKLMSVLLIFGMIINTSYAATEDVPPNPYECDYEELQRFIQNKMEGMEKGVNSGESWNNFKIAYTEAAAESGQDDCVPFWEEMDMSGLLDGLQDALDQIGGFISDPSSFFDALAKRIADRMKEMVNSIIEQLKKGICERLSEDFIAGKIQDKIEGEIKDKYDINIDISDGDVMGQLLDETVCAAAGKNPVGGTLDGVLSDADNSINDLVGTDIDYLSYGDETCQIYSAGSGDPNNPNEADKAREAKAEEMVDKELDKLDEFLWGD